MRLTLRTRLRLILEKKKRFERKKTMETVHIIDSADPIFEGANFSLHEFWSPVVTPVCLEFDMPLCLAKGVQAVRDYYSKKYKKPIAWFITSTYRPADTFGEHKTGCAVDSDAADINLRQEILNDIRNEFKNWQESELVKNILITGTNVLLIENVCLHLSVRDSNLNNHPLYEPPTFYIGEWEPDSTPYGINTCYA